MALYNGQSTSEMIMSVPGDFTLNKNPLQDANIGGVLFSLNGQYIRIFNNFAGVAQQTFVVGTFVRQTKMIVTKNIKYTEKIIHLL